MSNQDMLCRLCKSSKCLTNVNELDGDISIFDKIKYCVDLLIYPEDGLPTMICKRCKLKVKKYHNFKQRCIKTDLELKAMNHQLHLELNKTNTQTQILNVEKIYEDISDAESNDSMGARNEDFNFNIPMIYPEDHTSIQCEICGGMFSTKSEYNKHLSTHGDSKKFECEYCSKCFKRADSLKFHILSHLGIRPYICEKCGQSTTKRQDLIRHMKIHSDEKKHECHECGRRFKRSGDLSSHIRTHSGMRPYKCVLCDKDYTSHSGLRKHRKTHFRKEFGSKT